jgi:hypothetical protein
MAPRWAAQVKARFCGGTGIESRETLMVEVPPVSTTPGFAVKIPDVIGPVGGDMIKLPLSFPQLFRRKDIVRPDTIIKK